MTTKGVQTNSQVRPKKIQNNGKTSSPGARIWNKLHPGLMTEEEVMTEKPCVDFRGKRSYKLNDKIQLTIVAYDHYGNPKTEGGDLFLATIETESKNASAPGVVTDLLDGKYRVEMDALWTGKAVIRVTMAYTKQNIVFYLRSLIQHLPWEYTVATYVNKHNVTENSFCHPNHSMLYYDDICRKENDVRSSVCNDEGLTPERRQICNFTLDNSGSPFYCLTPLKAELGCKDWRLISRGNHSVVSKRTKCQLMSINRGLNQAIGTKIEVDISPESDRYNSSMVELPSIPCSKYNRTALWLRREPTGFFYNASWHLRHCKAQRDLINCMRNKNFYLIGDSTTRQWYASILQRYQCVQITEKWTNEKWYNRSTCLNKKYNFTVTFGIHNLPASVPPLAEKEVFLNSIGGYMDDVTDDENAVIVFHMFAHLNVYNPDVFRHQMKLIRTSVEKLLKRNKKVKIMFKAPHVYAKQGALIGYHFERIAYDIFYDLFDKIIYLNNRDSSIVTKPDNVHPDKNIVFAMRDQALAYACD
ncbi:Neurexophilin [Mactra antiquata]